MKKVFILLFLFMGSLSFSQNRFSYSKVVKGAINSVVEVIAKEKKIDSSSKKNNIFDFFSIDPNKQNGLDPLKNYRNGLLGSGVLVHRNGDYYYVLTNRHVVAGYDKITIILNTEEEYQAQISLEVPRLDIAVLKFKSKKPLQIAKLGDSDALEVGDVVIGIGSPLAFQSTVTSGIVSSLKRKGGPGINVSDFIQTDASINSGNSGGALIKADTGELIGINSWIVGALGNIGLGFAIPINNLKQVIKYASFDKKLNYKWAGLSLSSYLLDDDIARSLNAKGFKRSSLVASVYKDSPASKAGVIPGDLIYKIDDFKIQRMQDVVLYLSGLINEISNAKLYINRFGKKIELNLNLEKRENEEDFVKIANKSFPGISVYPITGELKRLNNSDLTGMVVTRVDLGTNAYRSRILPGDIIEKINGVKVETLKQFYKLINDKKVDVFNLQIIRKDVKKYLRLKR